MSISRIQKEMVLDEVARFYFSNGEKPTSSAILRDMSMFFADNPIGRPFNIEPNNMREGLVSNVDEVNDNMIRAVLNISILYESMLQDTERSMSLYSIVQTKLENLRGRRARIESDIDDFLLALNDSSGYFYSFSDYFSTLDYTDLGMSSAFVDIVSGQVSIPPVAEFSRPLPAGAYAVNSATMTVDGASVSYQTESPFDGAIDGLSNTNWAVSVSTNEVAEVIMEVRIDLSDFLPPVISKVEIDPFTMVPMQVFVETENTLSNSGVLRQRDSFGQNVKYGSYKMTFVDTATKANIVYITMRKTEPDYQIQDNSTNKHVYVFGASHLEISRQSYDTSAKFVSASIALPEEIATDHVIDSVSLSVDEYLPNNTSADYFIAADSGNGSSLDDFNWQQIFPVESSSSATGAALKLDGAALHSRKVKPAAEALFNDLELIPIDVSDSDLSKRNPTTTIVGGVDIYRIAEFKEEFIPQTMAMSEGVNSTRILSTALDPTVTSDLTYWASYIDGTLTANEFYGRIDTGNEFFYGGDIGANSKSVYIETYVDSPIDRETILKEFRKSDDNSQQWDVYVYLNGRTIASLPAGTDTALIPWKFNNGLNHVAMTIDIPAATTDHPTPYLGTIDLMVGEDLSAFGKVRLGEWVYVDPFKMEYNEIDEPMTFTIYNGEVISRRRPTTNFELRYAKPTGRGTSAIRFRADLQRSNDDDSVTPILDKYSIRFSYGDSE